MKILGTLLCATCACLALAGTASAQPWFGLNDTSVTGGQTSATKAATLADEAGADSVRVALNWSWVQPTDSTPNFSTFDAIYNADIAAGIHPLINLTGAPSWAWAPGTVCTNLSGCNYPPGTNHNADWQNIAAAVAKRYPEAAGIEIWNEPNMTWEWTGGVDPARYTQLLKLAYTAIKAVNPNMPVIGGALAVDLNSTADSNGMPLSQFLQTMYNDGAKGYMDGISLHPYPNAIDLFSTFQGIADTTDIRDANGDTVPLWVTETGLSTQQGFTQAQQAEVDAQLVSSLSSEPGIAGVYLYSLVEPSVNGQGYGLLTPQLGATPGFCAVAAAAGSSYSCPASVTQATASATQLGRWQAQALLARAADAAIAYHAANGTYTGLTSTVLNSLDPGLSATAAGGTPAGSGADPRQIGVYPLSSNSILLCNASTADLSYCTARSQVGAWGWYSATGSVYSAAYVAMHS